MLPTYEEIKATKEYKCWYLYETFIGGYFRLTIHENNENTIAMDYLDSNGYLSFINRKLRSNYHFSKLYKLNKKNYDGLISLYKKMLLELQKDLNKHMEELNIVAK